MIFAILFPLLSNLATVPSMRTTKSFTTFLGSWVNCFSGVPLTVFHRITVPSSEALQISQMNPYVKQIFSNRSINQLISSGQSNRANGRSFALYHNSDGKNKLVGETCLYFTSRTHNRHVTWRDATRVSLWAALAPSPDAGVTHIDIIRVRT